MQRSLQRCGSNCKYCDEIYVIQLFVREDFKMHLYRNLICFGNTIYSGGNIDILYLAIKMKLTGKKLEKTYKFSRESNDNFPRCLCYLVLF